ncbi:MAG: secretion protein HlyD [Cyanobacteria bacterium P01_H01_bin.74]
MAELKTISEQQAWKQGAEERRLLAFRSLKTPVTLLRGALWLIVMLIVVIVMLAFVPWQQTVNGVGEVTVLSPMSRPQELASSIPARIKRWFVAEGEWAEAGQPIVELEEIKIDYLDPQLQDRLAQKREAYLAKQVALRQEIRALQSEIVSVKQGARFAVPAARRKQEELSQKRQAVLRKVEGAEQAYETASINLGRRETLWKEGLRSKRDFEVSERTEAKALADLRAAEAEADSIDQAISAAGLTVGKTQADFGAKQASLAGKIAKAEQSLATIQGELQDLEIKLTNQIDRAEQRLVRAPTAGRLVRAKALGPGVTVKEGESLGLIMPVTIDRVAAIFVNDFNAPLIQVGQKVRLQFSGWPALQFSGFPQAAMGTFAGVVKVVDAVSDQANQFRLLVEMDEEAIKNGEQPWPEPELLRPGTQASGWVMLRTVPLGYELWRRFNGFPPSLRESTKVKKAKEPDIKSKAVKGAK